MIGPKIHRLEDGEEKFKCSNCNYYIEIIHGKNSCREPDDVIDYVKFILKGGRP